jgi:glycosyl transferase family 25
MPVRTSIHIISLANAEERRKEFTANAKTYLPWQFYDAHTSLTASMDYVANRAQIMGGRKLTPSELGCYASHFSLWQQLLNNDAADRYLIFEDDVIVDWAFIERLVALDDQEIGVNLLRLYYMKTVPTRKIKAQFIEVHEIVELRTMAFGLQAYLIDKVAAAKLVASLHDVIEPVDIAVESAWRHGVRNMCVFPFPIIHNLGKSQIGDTRWAAPPKPFWMKIVRGVMRCRKSLRKAMWELSLPKRSGY